MPDRDPQLYAAKRRNGRGFVAASRLVAQHLRDPEERRGYAEATLLSRWTEIVGADHATLCVPVRVKHTRGTTLGNTLVVLSTGSNAPLVAMRQEDMLARVNACYGYRAVSKIQITQTAPSGFAEGQATFAGPRAKAKPAEPDRAALAEAEATVSRIENPELRDALTRLSRNVLARQAIEKGKTS